MAQHSTVNLELHAQCDNKYTHVITIANLSFEMASTFNVRVIVIAGQV